MGRNKMILVLIACLISLNGVAQGVVFEKSLKEAFQKAKAQNKVLFVEYYSPSCPYCKQVAPLFQDPQVAKVYNSAFINYQLDVESEEAQAFAKSVDLDVYGIPYFLFFKPDSSLIHAREVSANVSSVTQPGNMVIADTYSAQHYPKRFANGERSENFLAQYALFSRVKKDFETNRKVIDELWKIYPEEKKSTQSSWIVVKKIVMDIDNAFVDYWLNHLEGAKAFEAASPYGSIENVFSRILYTTLDHPRAQTFDGVKWKEIRDKFGKALGQAEITSLVWEKELATLVSEKKMEKAAQLLKEMIGFSAQEPETLLYISKTILNADNAKDWSKIEEDLLNKIYPLVKGKDLEAPYYLEKAKFAKLFADKANAKEMGQKALQQAKVHKIDTKDYENFILDLK